MADKNRSRVMMQKSKPPLNVALALVCVATAGCTTVRGREKLAAEARLNAEVRNLQADVARLEERLEEIEVGRQDVYRRVESVESGAETARVAIRDRMDRIENAIAAQDAARSKDKQEIIDALSRRMAELVKAQAPSVRTSEGYEHIVQPGETLSEIASAYGVRTSVIVEANNLPNPEMIRVGQKLFIPE